MNANAENVALNVEKIKPEINLGISTMVNDGKPVDPAAYEKADREMAEYFGASGFCESCGVVLRAADRKTLGQNGAWFSVCHLCFYTCNLDKIPSFEKGRILFQPLISQTMMFTLIRARFSSTNLSKMSNADASPAVHEDIVENEATMVSLVDKLARASARPETTVGGESVDNFIHLMDLLRPEEYRDRLRLLGDYRWLPDSDLFAEGATYQLSDQFSVIHPETMDVYMEEFVLQYVPSLTFK